MEKAIVFTREKYFFLKTLKSEIQLIKRKYEDDWMKYYSLHLNPDCENENGKPYGYDFVSDDDEEDYDWWKK